MGRLAWIAFVIFVPVYGWIKYSAAAPAEFSSAYAQTTAALVVITGMTPFLLAWGVLKGVKLAGPAAALAGVALGVVFCVAGYALYWAVFIAPSNAEVPLAAVALRGIGWGALQGGLASIAARH